MAQLLKTLPSLLSQLSRLFGYSKPFFLQQSFDSSKIRNHIEEPLLSILFSDKDAETTLQVKKQERNMILNEKTPIAIQTNKQLFGLLLAEKTKEKEGKESETANKKEEKENKEEKKKTKKDEDKKKDDDDDDDSSDSDDSNNDNNDRGLLVPVLDILKRLIQKKPSSQPN